MSKGTQPSTYRLLDSGSFKKLEQIGPHIVVRPSPQAVWLPRLLKSDWDKADFGFNRRSDGDGEWWNKSRIPESLVIDFAGVRFLIKFTSFGHIGLFPEQDKNWHQIDESVKRYSDGCRVLNLFGYTGGTTLTAAKAGASVTHVDASKTSVAWAKENLQIAGLADQPVRFICEDARKFVAKEIRRKQVYQGIVLDPAIKRGGLSGLYASIRRTSDVSAWSWASISI